MLPIERSIHHAVLYVVAFGNHSAYALLLCVHAVALFQIASQCNDIQNASVVSGRFDEAAACRQPDDVGRVACAAGMRLLLC